MHGILSGTQARIIEHLLPLSGTTVIIQYLDFIISGIVIVPDTLMENSSQQTYLYSPRSPRLPPGQRFPVPVQYTGNQHVQQYKNSRQVIDFLRKQQRMIISIGSCQQTPFSSPSQAIQQQRKSESPRKQQQASSFPPALPATYFPKYSRYHRQQQMRTCQQISYPCGNSPIHHPPAETAYP